MPFSHTETKETAVQSVDRRSTAVAITEKQFSGKIGAPLWQRYKHAWGGGNNEPTGYFSSVFDDKPCVYVSMGNIDRVFTVSCNIELLEEAIRNKLNCTSEYTFYEEALLDMCDSASRDDFNKITPKNCQKMNPLWDLDIQIVRDGDIELMLKYLLVHGFSPECILSQASSLRTLRA